MGQTVHLIAACANLNGKTVCFEVYEKTPLLEEQDKALTLIHKDEPQSRIKVRVKDGFAVAEVKLQPCKEDGDNKHWLEKLKNGYHDDDSKTAELYLKVVATENIFTIRSSGEFLKESPFKLIGNNWHEPVDNPMITIYTQGGNNRPSRSSFGKVRTDINAQYHSGLDLFGTTGTKIYACVDGTVYNRRWHGGYGNTITIKVKNPKALWNRKIQLNYQLQYKDEGEMTEGDEFSKDGDLFLFYAHLDSVEEFSFGEKVQKGTVLGTIGRSGISAGTNTIFDLKVLKK